MILLVTLVGSLVILPVIALRVVLVAAVVEAVVVVVIAVAMAAAVMEAMVVAAEAATRVRLDLLYSPDVQRVVAQIFSILPDWLAGGGGSLWLSSFVFRIWQVTRPLPFKRGRLYEGCEHDLVKQDIFVD